VILEIDHDGHHKTVEVSMNAGSWTITVDGRGVPCDWVRIAESHYSLILEGRVYDFLIESSDSGCVVAGREGRHAVRITDTRKLQSQSEVAPGQTGLQRLTADMPGKVVRVLVQVGDTVGYDQGLLVLEAMKMQNEIRSPKSGVIREIAVVPGKAVNTGEFLLSLE
jgi:biotin carboxyl carrier protein